MSTSCSFYWWTSMLNQNHILVHRCIKCINLTQALMKILLVCWMNKCDSFTNLRIVNTLTHALYIWLSLSSSFSQQPNDKQTQTICPEKTVHPLFNVHIFNQKLHSCKELHKTRMKNATTQPQRQLVTVWRNERYFLENFMTNEDTWSCLTI